MEDRKMMEIFKNPSRKQEIKTYTLQASKDKAPLKKNICFYLKHNRKTI